RLSDRPGRQRVPGLCVAPGGAPQPRGRATPADDPRTRAVRILEGGHYGIPSIVLDSPGPRAGGLARPPGGGRPAARPARPPAAPAGRGAAALCGGLRAVAGAAAAAAAPGVPAAPAVAG